MNSQALLAASLDATGKMSDAYPLWSSCVALAEKVADGTWLTTVLWFAAAAARLGGKWDDARRRLDRGLDVWPTDPRLLGERAVLEAHLGRFDEAERLLDQVVEVMQSSPPGPTDEYAHPAMAIAGVAHIAGSGDRLEVALRAAEPVISSPHVSPWLAQWASAGLAVASVIEGDSAAASDLYQTLEAHRGTFVHGGSPASVDRLLGLIASSLGRLDAADAHFEEAILLCRQPGYAVELAWSLHERAALLVKRGRRDDAEEASALLDESLALERELGLAPLVERARVLADR